MKYEHILAFVAGTPWAIEPVKAQAIMSFLAFKAAGGVKTEAEIAAISDPQAASQPRSTQQGAVAVISLRGVISPRIEDAQGASGPGGTSSEGFAKRVRAAAANKDVTRIILDVDSPGGAVSGVADAADAVYEARQLKPVIAVANNLAASAAYWIATQADELVVTSTAEVGSIGVYAYHEDLSAYLQKKGVKSTLIKANDSPNKAGGHPAFPLDKTAKLHMQESVDEYMSMFFAAVARGRGVSADLVKSDFGGGLMFHAQKAVALGMADRIGTLDDEIQSALGSGTSQVPSAILTGGTMAPVANSSSNLKLRRRRLALSIRR